MDKSKKITKWQLAEHPMLCAIIGAIISGAIGLAGVLISINNTTEKVERSIVSAITSKFDLVDKNIEIEDALEAVYQEIIQKDSSIDDLANANIKLTTEVNAQKNLPNEIDTIKTENEELKNKNADLTNQVSELNVINEQLSKENEVLKTKVPPTVSASAGDVYDLVPIQGRTHILKEAEQTSNYNNTYYNPFSVTHYSYDTEDDDWPIYNLEGKYKKISGQMALLYSDKDTKGTFWIDICNENGKILSSSQRLSAGSDAVNFEFDISGLDKIKIAYRAKGAYSYLTRIIYPTYKIE